MRIKNDRQLPTGQQQVRVARSCLYRAGQQRELALCNRVLKQERSQVQHHRRKKCGGTHLTQKERHLGGRAEYVICASACIYAEYCCVTCMRACMFVCVYVYVCVCA